MLFMDNASRREFLKKALALAGGMITAGAAFPSRLFSAPVSVNGSALSVVKGKDLSRNTIEAMVKTAFRDLGGVGRFVRKGMTVVIKPNIGWNSTPEMAHNTNPDLVAAVARMCVEAGAKVRVLDRSVNAARLTYRRSGIQEAAERAGAKVVQMDDDKFRKTAVPRALSHETLQVYEDVLKADVFINMPIAKHHSLSTLTMAMKNLMGVLGGNRGFFHFDIDRSIVDFNKAVKSHLVILDATRILTAHGPNGGTVRDVKELRTIVAGINPVTVDAYAATFFGIRPDSLGYLALAAKEGMGEIDPARMTVLQRSI